MSFCTTMQNTAPRPAPMTKPLHACMYRYERGALIGIDAAVQQPSCSSPEHLTSTSLAASMEEGKLHHAC